jgi:hypothetical protein
MDRWIAKNPRWTYELDGQARLVTADWLDGVARYVTTRARAHRNDVEQHAQIRALLEACKRAGDSPVRLRWIARADSASPSVSATPAWAERTLAADPRAR